MSSSIFAFVVEDALPLRPPLARELLSFGNLRGGRADSNTVRLPAVTDEAAAIIRQVITGSVPVAARRSRPTRPDPTVLLLEERQHAEDAADERESQGHASSPVVPIGLLLCPNVRSQLLGSSRC